MESQKRTLAKTISYRVVVFLITFIALLVLTGNFVAAIGAGFLDSLVRFLVYYLHERTWNKINWDRN